MITEIIQIGDELGVLIPDRIAKKINLKVGDKVIIEYDEVRDVIVLRKKKN